VRQDLRIPVSLIQKSLREIEKEEILSKHGKNLLAIAIANTDRMEKLLLHEKKKSEKWKLYPSADTVNSTDTAHGKETLLLAENNNEIYEHFQKDLIEKYQVIHADDGAKALKLAKEINPDIIIADAFLPVLSGYELCRMLKSSVGTSHIPIILMSALRDKENIIFGLEAGANDYIFKPFDFDILKARIRNILQSRDQLHEIVFTETRVEETKYTNELDIEFLDKAKQIVETEIDNPDFSINDFCSMLAMSRSSVYNKLKALTGQPPNDFIRIIRLNKAKGLLASKKYTVSEVSYKVGFTDSKYFSTSFKKQFGISPSKVE
jgi:Response regulators consisting of a CheY-like receiver domain and a winged-helix DNA-binding domain